MEDYKAKHKHPLNTSDAYIGIPMIVVSLPLFFFRLALGARALRLGWIFQFIGHAIEGNQPAFFRNPVYLHRRALWIVQRALPPSA